MTCYMEPALCSPADATPIPAQTAIDASLVLSWRLWPPSPQTRRARWLLRGLPELARG